MNSNRQIVNGVIITYITIAVEVVMGMVYTPWMIKTIGSSAYGIYSLATSFIALFIMDFGLGSAVSKFLSKYRFSNDKQKISEFLGVVYKLYLTIDIIILIILIVSYLNLNNVFKQLTSVEIEQMKVVFLISGLCSIINFPCITFNGILTSYEKFTFMKSAQLISKLLTTILIIVSLICGYGLYALVIVNAVVSVGMNMLKFLYVKKIIKIKADFKYFDKKMLKEIFGFSIWVTVALIAEQLTLNLSPTILGIVGGGTNDISIFSVGRSIYTYFLTIASAVNGLFLPKVTHIALKSDSAITDLAVRVGKFQTAVLGLFAIGIVGLGKEFMTLWMGSEYSASYYVAFLLIIPAGLTATQNIAYVTAYVKDKVWITSVNGLVTTIIFLGLGIYLSAEWGAVGLACSYCVGAFIGNILVGDVLYHKYADIDIKSLLCKCYLKYIPIIVVSGIAIITLNKIFALHSWLTFCLKVAVVAALYIVLIRIFFISKSEFSTIVVFLRRNRK